MASIITILYEKYLQPYRKQLLVFLVFIIFVVIGYYGYSWFGKPVVNNQQEMDMANYNGRVSDVKVMFFTADWCPHCKKAKPEWERIKEEYNEHSINGYTVYFRTINCTDENDVEIKDLQNKYTIDGYPTIKLLKDGEVISYDAKPDFETLQKFLQTVLTN